MEINTILDQLPPIIAGGFAAVSTYVVLSFSTVLAGYLNLLSPKKDKSVEPINTPTKLLCSALLGIAGTAVTHFF